MVKLLLENEIWVDVDGFNGKYKVSNMGRVMSTCFNKPKIMKQIIQDSGYVIIWLGKKFYRVNRLVALHFISNPNMLAEVNHKNEIKTDNRVDNLEWCSKEYNVNYGTCQSRRAKTLREKSPLNKPIMQLDLMGNVVKEWISVADAVRSGYSRRSIDKCLMGKQEVHREYKWKYIK